jgi:hypothetical protein
VPRAGTWLSEYVAANTRLRSKLPALVPKDSLLWGTYVERDSWRPEDRAQFLGWMAEIRDVPAADLAVDLGVPPEIAADLQPLVGPSLAIFDDLAGGKPFEGVAWMPRGEMELGAAFRGPDPAQLRSLFAAGIDIVRKHRTPRIRTARSYKAKGLVIHELVITTTGDLAKRFGPGVFLTATVADDVVLLRIANDGDAKALVAMRKQLARASLQDVKPREFHLDFGEIVTVFAPGGQFAGALFGISPGTLGLDYEVAVEGPSMVTALRVDVVKWMEALARMSAWTKPSAP